MGHSSHLLSFWAHLRDAVSKAFTAALHFALPPRCPGCGNVQGRQGGFCPDCWQGLQFLSGPGCVRCGISFDVEGEMGDAAECGQCLADPPPWRRARAALAYDDSTRHIVMRLKYGRRTGLAKLMAQGMVPHLPAFMEQGDILPLLVPVPLHRWRLWQRGFNQSALIAGHIGHLSGLPVDVLSLRRVRRTRPLRGMNPSQRRREVAGVFAVTPQRKHHIEGRAIILIDDVHTSGATARACADVLLKEGAVSVSLLCWARVLPGRAGGREEKLTFPDAIPPYD